MYITIYVIKRQNITMIQCMRIACEKLTAVTREFKLNLNHRKFIIISSPRHICTLASGLNFVFIFSTVYQVFLLFTCILQMGKGISISVPLENLYPVTKTGHHQPTSQTPLKWHLTSSPMMARHRQLCACSKVPNQYS